MKPTFKILVTSQKGGVGKSTLSANLAAYFQSAGSKVTLLDFDTHGSSSSWLSHSPDLGVEVWHRILPLNQGSNRPFMDARMHLRRAASISEVVVCDLTWTDSVSSELMCEYDLVIVPTSVSDIELAATAEFLERHSWVFERSNRTSPILLLTPMRVQLSQLMGDVFSIQRFPISFLLAPPVLESQAVRDLFQRGYLKDLSDACGESFNEFCKAVCSIRNMLSDSKDNVFQSAERQFVGALQKQKLRSDISVTRRKLIGQYSILDRYHLENMENEKFNTAKDLSHPLNVKRPGSFFPLKLPSFLNFY